MSAETFYYHFDGLGSTVALTDSSQSVTDTYTYKAFGEQVASSGITVNPFRFGGQTGYYFNSDIADYYVRARNYSPVITRWLIEDLIGLHRRESNLYRYTSNNPVNAVDPSGLAVGILGGCGIGFVWGGLGGGLVNAANIGNFGSWCCQASCGGAGGCVTGAIIASFPSPAAGCIGGAIGSIVSAACESSLCGTRGPIGLCDFAFAAVNGILGCVAGYAAENGRDVDGILAALGINIGVFSSICSEGGPGPQLGKACCTFRNSSGTQWSETVDVPIGGDPVRACRDQAEGWFVVWEIVGAKPGNC